MNQSLLITNPFLFPPSGDNEEEKQLFQTRKEQLKSYILYSFKEFNKAWNEASEDGPNKELPGDLFPNQFEETLTSPKEETMEDIWDLDNFDLYGNFSPIFPNSDSDYFEKPEKESSSGLPATESFKNDLLKGIDQGISAINNIDNMMFDGEGEGFGSGGELHKQQSGNLEQPTESQNSNSQVSQMEEGEAAWLSHGNFDILSVAAEDPYPQIHLSSQTNDLMTVDPTALHHQSVNPVSLAPYEAIAIKKEPVEIAGPSTPSPSRSQQRNRRKSVQAPRLDEEGSSMIFVDEEETSMDLQTALIPPNPTAVSSTALVTLNGTGDRARHQSTSSTVMCPTPESTTGKSRSQKNSEERKKRKYECEDDNDPSVKNAKAAKLNREKKKKQLNDLQGKVNALQLERDRVCEELNKANSSAAAFKLQSAKELEQCKRELAEEKRKNAQSGIQRVRMVDYIQSFMSAMQPGSVPPVYVTDRLANLPMPTPQELPAIRRSMQSNPSTSADDTGAYLTAKVTVGGTPSIIFDYDESRLLQN